jgi:hypothetical protein
MIFRSKIYTYSKTPNICRNNISNGSNHLGTRFCLYVHHTDADREWAYDRTSSIGRLDKGLACRNPIIAMRSTGAVGGVPAEHLQRRGGEAARVSVIRADSI